jgi:pilus assembly protein Flp/PilA
LEGADQMMRLYTRFQVWRANDEGATAVEYGLMVGLIAAVIVGAVTAFGLNVKGMFDTTVANLP